MIRTQYLETLYISKASLAYFPKGPLSRARTVFNTDYNTSISQNDLIAFLRSLVLSFSLVDKKYKKSVPEFVGSLRTSNFSEDDVDPFVAKGRKKRRGKKMKPGKDGLYPGEDDYLKKWWMDGDSEHSMDSSEETKSTAEQIKRVANLRIRETELQMILMLEILALQESAHSKEQREDRTKPITGTPKKEEKGGKAKRNSNKDSSLALMLELLVDRLCIWQSVGSEDDATAALDMDDLSNSKAPGRKNKSTRATGAKALESKANNNDHLRDFHKEVIMPLYAVILRIYFGFRKQLLIYHLATHLVCLSIVMLSPAS
jgi:DNA replication regulator SLD3